MSANEAGGSSFGKVIGYLILAAAVIGVVVWFIIRPALEERGYTRDGLEQKAEDIKEKVSDTADAAGDKIRQITSKGADAAEETGEKVEDAAENVKQTGEKAARKIEKSTENLEIIDL